MEIFKNALKQELGTKADSLDFANSDAIKIPSQIRDEIPTMNCFGYMKSELDEFCSDFIDHSEKTKDLVLELGCAYGFVAQKVLKAGGNIVVNDLSFEHLQAVAQNTEKEKRKSLYLYQGAFPNEVDFSDELFGAVLSSRMFHFLKGDDIEAGLIKIHRWLKPKGKFYYTGVTPFNYTLRDNFLEVYKKRVTQNIKWPGEVHDFHDHAKEHRKFVGNFIHAFDIPHLNELLPRLGFKIEKIKLFDYPNNRDSDGKGHIGFVASKV